MFAPLKWCLTAIILRCALTSGHTAPPRIITQPAPALAHVGESARFSVEATGDAPLSYSWFYERSLLSASNSPTLTLKAVDAGSAGLYWVVISNPEGRVGSDAALLRVANSGTWSETNGGNGHRYDFVRIGNRENDWRVMFHDVYASGGYLVSYHSIEEENFVNTLAPTSVTRLLGLIQPAGSPAAGLISSSSPGTWSFTTT